MLYNYDSLPNYTTLMTTLKTDNKKSLPVISNTCYEAIEKKEIDCERKSCKQWIEHKKGHNCVFIATQQGPLTLREIGKIYGLTRMRICQIEKSVYQKIQSFIF